MCQNCKQTTTMKTNKEWLSELPDGYRELALANYDNCDVYQCTDEDTAPTMAGALCNSFQWKDSPEGREFWDAVHCYYRDSSRFGAPPLPESRIPNAEHVADLRSSDSAEFDDETYEEFEERKLHERIAELEDALVTAERNQAEWFDKYSHNQYTLTEAQSRISILESALDAAITEAEYIRRHVERGITFSATLLDDIKKLRA